MPIFKTEKISPTVTRIFGFTSELMYLVEGSEKAALLDTGSGYGSLKACVDELTDKPVTVLITHGHLDHAMGAIEFDDVYMSHKDFDIFERHGELESRRQGMNNVRGGVTFTDEDFILTADKSLFKDLKHGDLFDLGGVSVEVYECPGHTMGSLVFLLREERTLLLGDACNPRTFLFDTNCTGVKTYKKSLEKLKGETDGKYDRVYLSHGHMPGEQPRTFAEMIESNIAVCDDILAGRSDEEPFEFMGMKALTAKATENFARKDGGMANIVYNKDRIND